MVSGELTFISKLYCVSGVERTALSNRYCKDVLGDDGPSRNPSTRYHGTRFMFLLHSMVDFCYLILVPCSDFRELGRQCRKACRNQILGKHSYLSRLHSYHTSGWILIHFINLSFRDYVLDLFRASRRGSWPCRGSTQQALALLPFWTLQLSRGCTTRNSGAATSMRMKTDHSLSGKRHSWFCRSCTKIVSNR